MIARRNSPVAAGDALSKLPDIAPADCPAPQPLAAPFLAVFETADPAAGAPRLALELGPLGVAFA